MDSDWGVLGLHGKLIKSTFIWIRPHIHICSESAAVIDLLPRPFLSTVRHHLILTHGPCIKWGPIGACPRVLGRPHLVLVVPYLLIYFYSCHKQIEFCLDQVQPLLLACKRACWSSRPSSSLRNPTSFVIEFEIETLHSHLVNSVLVPYLFLLVLRLLAGQVPQWPGDALHKIAASIGGGVSVAKAQCPLEGCSRAVNVVSSNRVIPHLLIERSGTNPSGFSSVGNQSKVYR